MNKIATIKTIERLGNRSVPYLKAIQEGAYELLWPKRCAICDRPGSVLCKACLYQLPYIDKNLSCPTCGAPYGKYLCTECNGLMLSRNQIEQYPLDGLVSVINFQGSAQRIVTTYKDKNEQSLSVVLGIMLAQAIPYSWLSKPTILTTIPSRKEALQTRSFDHMDLLSKQVSKYSKLPYYQILSQSKHKDQRKLSARSRMKNMKGTFEITPSFRYKSKSWSMAEINVIVLDDVTTTGATLFSAAETLRSIGFGKVYGLTVGRVINQE